MLDTIERQKKLRAMVDTAMAQESPEDDDLDMHRSAPRPDEKCLYGLVGEIARAGSANTEANPFAIAAYAICYLGAAIGRGTYIELGDEWHHTRLFFAHVGRSGLGRKGTAKKLIGRIDRAMNEKYPLYRPQLHTGGLSTREGLAKLIHDGFKDGQTEVSAIDDKRLLVVESEFSNILHQAKRDGNTLSAALRDAWDGGSIRPAVKTHPIGATDPHIGLMVDITPSELKDLLAARELSNGFANRFIFFWAERSRIDPEPLSTPQNVVNQFASRIHSILEFANAEGGAAKDQKKMDFSEEARQCYRNLYVKELSDRTAGDRVAGLLERRAATLVRLAMIFAITDLSQIIEAHHVEAAMAWIRYWTDSVKFIWQTGLDEVRTAKVAEHAKKIMEHLGGKGEASRTELSRDCFKGHVDRGAIDAALDELLTRTPRAIEIRVEPRKDGNGCGTKFYRLAKNEGAKSANCAKPEQLQGLAGDKGNVRTVRTLEKESEPPPPQFADFAEFAHPLNQSQTIVSIDNSHNSHNSQAVFKEVEI